MTETIRLAVTLGVTVLLIGYYLMGRKARKKRIERLNEMLKKAKTEKQKEVIQKAIDKENGIIC